MTRGKVVIFSGAVALLSVAIAISHSGIGAATTLFRHADDARLNLNINEDLARERAGLYGKTVASWLNGNVPCPMVPSAAVGVILGNRLIFHHGVHADIDTRFGIASLSKTFTAVLALILHEEKILSLDDPVSKYLPGVVIERPELKSAPVTIRHLLAHTSGIPSFGSRHRVYEIHGKRISVPEQIHPAGYCYSYSNEGYELLLHVIEAATGVSYARNMRERVFEPLGMKSSTAEFANGTGGIVSTVRDLSKYAAMLINRGTCNGKRIMREDSFSLMLAKEVELPPTKVDYYYSLSWEVITVDGAIDSYYKAGRWFNQASGMQVFPAKSIAFVYLCNPPEHLGGSFMSWRQGLTGMMRMLVRKIAGDESLCSLWPALNADELKWYEGTYRNILTGERVNVLLRNGVLYSNGFGGFMPMRTFTSNRFLIDEGRMLHNFVWKDNRVVGLALRHGYYEYERQ